MLELAELDMSEFNKIKTLFRSVFTGPPWNEDWNDEEQLDNYLLELMEVRNSLILGLYEADEFIGVSIGKIKHWCSGTEYFIEELCIKADLQHKGYGTKFFSLIEDYLKERGLNQIYLETERNVPAYDFYRKLNFQELPSHVSFIKEF